MLAPVIQFILGHGGCQPGVRRHARRSWWLSLAAALLATAVSLGWCGVCGDCDGDGSVDVADAVLALRAAVGLSSLSAEQMARCDVDGDGRLEVREAFDVLRLAVGLGGAKWGLPQVEVVPENSGAKWTEVLAEPGVVRAWAVRVGATACFCSVSDTPVMFEGVDVEGWTETAEAGLVLVTGTLIRGEWGRHRIVSPVVEKVRCIPSLPKLTQWSRLLQAVAAVDLGKVSHPTYAQATSAVCRSSGWMRQVSESLATAKPEMVGASVDGRYVAFSVWGPRLPPLNSIVFRYMRVTLVYDLLEQTPCRVVVDVKGWVEE